MNWKKSEVAQREMRREDWRVAQLLTQLRDLLQTVAFPIPLPNAAEGAEIAHDCLNQLSDYILPRLERLDAPLVAVVGGSTGAGKSTLVNSLIGKTVARASAIRPTTRRPLILCHPDDLAWFDSQRILPKLARVQGDNLELSTAGKIHPDEFSSIALPRHQRRSQLNADLLGADTPGQSRTLTADSDAAAITEIALTATDSLQPGLALIDAPDIDSVVRENRQLAAQLMQAADLWLFVTTAHRYADAIPWAMLAEAASREIVIGVVLNRVPAGAGVEVRADLARRLQEAGLSHAPLFVIGERELEKGLIQEADVAPIRSWLRLISKDPNSRVAIAKQTLQGAVLTLVQNTDLLLAAISQQIHATENFAQIISDNYQEATTAVSDYFGNGSLLRGEVLSRWQEILGASQWAKQLSSGVSRLRDKLSAFFFAQKPNTAPAQAAIEAQMRDLLVTQAELAAARILRDFESQTGGTALATEIRKQLRLAAEREIAAGELVRQWQRSLLDLISEQGSGKKFQARMLSFGVNAVGIALMITVFASTGGLVGGEVAVAGGTAVLAQKLLEAVFGDEAVRKMTAQARTDFLSRAAEFLAADEQVFQDAVQARAQSAENFAALQNLSAELANEISKGGR